VTAPEDELPENLDELARDLQPVTPPVMSALWLRRKLRKLWNSHEERVHAVWFFLSMLLLLVVVALLLRLNACSPTVAG
jgi:hypothetical protein